MSALVIGSYRTLWEKDGRLTNLAALHHEIYNFVILHLKGAVAVRKQNTVLDFLIVHSE